MTDTPGILLNPRVAPYRDSPFVKDNNAGGGFGKQAFKQQDYVFMFVQLGTPLDPMPASSWLS
jgi:hypothetical protein